MLDWLGKMLDLPEEFLACSGGKGGGVIQGTASEATLVALLGAKARAVSRAKEQNPDMNDSDIISKLVGYTSCKYIARFFFTIFASFYSFFFLHQLPSLRNITLQITKKKKKKEKL